MKKLIFYIALLLSMPVAFAADDITFTAKAPGSVVEGNQFRLEFNVNARSADNLRVPPVDGFRVLAGPTTTSYSNTQYINGKMTSEAGLRITYILLAEKPGTYTMPAATVDVKGKTYTSNTLTVKVLQTGQSSSAGTSSKDEYGIAPDDLFVRTLVSKKKVFQQEYLVSTVKLYSRLDIRGFEKVVFPKYNGFWQYEIDMPDQLQFGIEAINGKNYRVAVMKQTILFPQRSGKLEVEPTQLDVIIRLRTQRRSQSIFDDFFDSYQDVRRKVKSKGETITVSPFPAGRPAGFSSLAGTFKMSSSVDLTEVKANEPVTLKITISGNGNLKMIKTPEINFPGDFETYDPKVTNSMKNTVGGVTGTRTFEYLVIPRFGGEFTIPSYTFSYFDTKTKAYKTLSTQEYVINVEKGTQQESTVVNSGFASKENVKFLGKDIRFIKTGSDNLKQKGAFLFGSTKYWLGFIIPIVLFVLILILLNKQRKERANVTQRKRKKANPVARKKLKKAQALMKGGDREAFYDEVLRALWGYVADKLSIKVAELNKDNIRQIMVKRKASEVEVDQFLGLLDKCEFARFSPSQGEDELEHMYKDAISLIGRLESQIK